MTLERVKQEILEQRSYWLTSLIKDGSDYANGKVSALDYVLDLLSKVKEKKA